MWVRYFEAIFCNWIQGLELKKFTLMFALEFSFEKLNFSRCTSYKINSK